MAETQAPHYPTWIKPDIGGDAANWGNVLNTTIDAIDAVVYANQQAGVPIGSMTMFAGSAAPANWLICDGRSLDGSSSSPYNALFNLIGLTYGGSGSTFNLPNLQQKFPLGAGPNPVGTSSGSFSYSIATANLPAHAHPIIDVAHNHTASQPAHVHPDPGHTHTASEAAHAHGSSLMRFIGGSGQPLGIVGGGNANVNYGNTDSASSTVTINAGATNLQAAGADAITVAAAGTGLSTTQAVGSGTPLSIVPPFIAINFIIRYL